MERAFTKQSTPYNLRHRRMALQIGRFGFKKGTTLVVCSQEVQCQTCPKICMPFCSKKILSPVVYDLRTPEGKWVRNVHIKDLKPFVSDQAPENPGIVRRVASVGAECVAPTRRPAVGYSAASHCHSSQGHNAGKGTDSSAGVDTGVPENTGVRSGMPHTRKSRAESLARPEDTDPAQGIFRLWTAVDTRRPEPIVRPSHMSSTPPQREIP